MLLLFFGCKQDTIHFGDEVKTDLLVIYCLENFVSSGLSSFVIPAFESRYDCKVDLRIIDGSETLLSRIIRERNFPEADIAIGIKNTQLFRAMESDAFLSNEPSNIRNITDSSLLLDRRLRLIPHTFSYYAFVYDSQAISDPPKTFGGFQGSNWIGKFIIPDPAVSHLGRGVLLWTSVLFGERGFENFWTIVRDNMLKQERKETPFLDARDAYIAFITDEAPIMLLNSTYPAFFIEVESTDRYKAFIPSEGGFKEIEFAGILRGSQNIFLARRFMDFMLTNEYQRHIPTTLWMYPVIPDIHLPNGFAFCPVPTQDLTERIFDRRDLFSDRWIDTWKRIITTGK
jgi:thiamine transport system substrate-binding protein